jgi:hypothetical protein
MEWSDPTPDQVHLISQRYAEAMVTFAQRWQSLRLTSDEDFLYSLESLTVFQLPMLREFSYVEAIEPGTWLVVSPRPRSLNFFSKRPLTSLSLEGHLASIELPSILSHYLTYVTIKCPINVFYETGGLLKFLSECTALQYLDIDFNRLLVWGASSAGLSTSAMFYGPMGRPAGRITLPSLQELKAKGGQSSSDGSSCSIADLWESLNLPQLSYISFDINPSWPTDRIISDSEAFAGHVSLAESCSTITINLDHGGWGLPQVDDLHHLGYYFSACSTVSSLTITDIIANSWGLSVSKPESKGPKLLELLLPQQSNKGCPIYMPEMKSLTLNGCFESLDTSLIESTLEARATGSAAGICCPLGSLEVEVSKSLDSDSWDHIDAMRERYGTNIIIHCPAPKPPHKTSAFEGVVA